MENATIKRPRFTEQSYDKFEGKTITTWLDPLKDVDVIYSYWGPDYYLVFEPYGYKNKNHISLFLQLVQTAGNEQLSISYEYSDGAWMFLGTGALIINLNDTTNIRLPATETGKTIYAEINTMEEKGYYAITREQLHQIAAAEKLSLRLSSESAHLDIHETSGFKFLFMCRSFIAETENDPTYNKWIEDTMTMIMAKATTRPERQKGCLVQVLLLLLALGTAGCAIHFF